jgi:hypothetical protein
MSQSALLTKEAVNVSATEVFPEITVNGEVVPLVSGVTVVFTAENGWDLKVEVKAYPLPPSGYPNFYFRMFERWSGNDKVLYDILPAKRLWIDGKQVLKFNGVAYSAERSEIVLLEPAQDKWGARLITSPILYRTKGKSSNEGAARKFETVEVRLPQEAQ